MRYFDHAASAPVREAALAAYVETLRRFPANPASAHSAGLAARAVLDEARRRIATALGARPGDVVFTSGGTEANNLAIIGIARAADPAARHLVTSPIEHDSVRRAIAHLVDGEGFEVTVVGVDAAGRVDPDEVADAVRPTTALVSIGAANNEIGTVQPLAEIAARLGGRDRRLPGRAWLHTDAVQAVGRIPLEVGALGVAALALAGHKLGAPRGIGAAVIRRRVPLAPLVHGGGQQEGRRSGTEDAAGAVALATALELVIAERDRFAARSARLAEECMERIVGLVPGARRTGARTPDRIPGHASVILPGIAGEALLHELDRRGIFASGGSACGAAAAAPSHVLLAIGASADDARAGLRLTTGLDGDFEGVPEAVADAVAVVRGLGV